MSFSELLIDFSLLSLRETHRYTALGLLKGCKTDAGTGVVRWAAGEGMGLSAAGGIFLNVREE